MNDINAIREKCEALLTVARACGDMKRIAVLEEIERFLQKDNCFAGAEEVDACYYMVRLGYDFDEANQIYSQYNRIPAYQGYLEYVDQDGDIIREDAVLRPDVEDYYVFDDGCIFKFDDKKKKFYSLIDGEWVYDGDLERKFYDAGYGYERVKYRITEEIMQDR